MMKNIEILKSFRDGVINDTIMNHLQEMKNIKLDNFTPLEIRLDHIINILEKFLSGKIDKNKLLIWVNTIWFSDYYDYKTEQMDSISSVINELEELDEDESKISSNKIKDYIHALQNNIEI